MMTVRQTLTRGITTTAPLLLLLLLSHHPQPSAGAPQTCAACHAGSMCRAGAAIACSAGTFSAGGGLSTCATCAAGTFANGSGMSSCLPCANGSFVAVGGATACAPCGIGHFCPDSTTPQVPCPVNSYSNGSATACRPCDANAFTNGATGSGRCLCRPGGVMTSSAYACATCGAGSFSAGADGLACSACVAGSFAAAAGSTACAPCAAGFFGPSAGASGCAPCGAGMFSNASGATACAECGPGLYASANASDGCARCAAGSYNPTAASTNCSQCGVGTYAPATGATACAACSPGKLTSAAGATSAAQCQCPTNSEYDGTACVCWAGFYRQPTASAYGYQCARCPAGSFCGNSSAPEPTPCPDGHFCLAGATAPILCATCQTGTFQSSACAAAANRQCAPCDNAPPHSTYQGTSLTPTCPWVCDSRYGGPSCEACLAGFWCLYGTMNKCPYNSLSAALSFAQSNCSCLPGYSSEVSTPGSSLCVKCVAGTICPGGEALPVSVVSLVPLPNVTQVIMVQKALPPTDSLVALVLSVPSMMATLTASVNNTANGVLIYTRQVCRAGYCLQCDRTTACVTRAAVGLTVGAGGRYVANVTALKYDVLYTFVCAGGCCAPTFPAVPPEYTDGSALMLTSLSGVAGSVAFSCPGDPAGIAGTLPIIAGGARRRHHRRLLQVTTDSLAVDFVVPPAQTVPVVEAIQAASFVIQGYVAATPTPPTPSDNATTTPPATAPRSCPSHSTSPEGATSLSQCVCFAGYYGNSSSGCALCVNGSYCASGALNPCPTNAHSPSGASTIDDCTCLAGFYPSSGGCAQCPANAFCAGGATPLEWCVDQAISPAQSTSADACHCRPGYAGVANAACEPCEAGTWCWTGVKNTCPTHSTSLLRSTRLDNCTCDDGYQTVYGTDGHGLVTKICAQCGASTYCKVRWPQTLFKHPPCHPIEMMMARFRLATILLLFAPSLVMAIPCPDGQYSSSDVCVPCTPASYCPVGSLFSLPPTVFLPTTNS